MPKSGMPEPTATAIPDVTSLDRFEGSATTLLYRAAIGPINTDYYLPIFTRFEAADRAGPSWNWAASLCTLNWLVFRRLWMAALVYAGAVIAAAVMVFGLGGLWFEFSNSVAMGLLLALAGLGFGLPGVFGNALLHAESRKKMAHALAASDTLAQASAMLNRQASSRRNLVWLILANLLFAAAAAGVYLAFSGAARSPLAGPKVAEVRNVAVGRATDLTPQPAPAPVAVPAPVTAAILPPVAQPASTPHAMAPLVSASAPAIAQHFYINVGLFSKETNAHKAHRKLRDAGLAAFRQELDTPKGRRIRVRVGPFDTQSEADAVAAKIHALKLDAVVFGQ